MNNIETGHLRVLTYSNIYVFSGEDAANAKHRAEVRVLNDTFWVRVCAMGDLGFAEAYMFGDCMVDDLVSLFHVAKFSRILLLSNTSQIFLDNKERLSNLDSKLSYLFTLPQKLTSYRFLNTLGNSRSNISAHYDISNDMFAGMVGSFLLHLTYCCLSLSLFRHDLLVCHLQRSRRRYPGRS